MSLDIRTWFRRATDPVGEIQQEQLFTAQQKLHLVFNERVIRQAVETLIEIASDDGVSVEMWSIIKTLDRLTEKRCIIDE